MTNLIQNLNRSFGVKIVAYTISFIGSVYITRLLGPNFLGIRTYILTNATLISILIGFNLKSVLSYFIASKKYSSSRILASSKKLLLLSISLTAILSIWLTCFDKSYVSLLLLGGKLGVAFQLFIISSILNLIVPNFFFGVWTGLKKFDHVNFAALINPTISLIVFASLYYFYPNASSSMLFHLFNIISVLNILAISAMFFYMKYPIKDKLFFENATSLPSEMKIFIKSTFLITILSFLMKKVDVWFIQYFTSSEQLGLYGLATSLSDTIIALFIPVLHVLGPYITQFENDKKQINQMFASFFKIFFTISLILALALFIFSELIINTLYTEEFNASIQILQILSVGMFLLILRNLCYVYFNSINKLKPILLSNFLSLIITIVIAPFIIPIYGIVGAAYLSVFSYLIGLLWLLYLSNRELKFHKQLISFDKDEFSRLIKLLKSK